jgi:hypothetical protein
MLSQASRCVAKKPALGNAAKILLGLSSKENQHGCPWYDCAPHLPKILYSVCTAPTSFVPGEHLVFEASTCWDQTVPSRAKLLDTYSISTATHADSAPAGSDTQADPLSEAADVQSAATDAGVEVHSTAESQNTTPETHDVSLRSGPCV